MPPPSPLPDFLHELGKRVAGELRTDAYSRVFYSTDASIYQVEPFGVLIPRTSEDLHAAVELAAQYQIPLLPRGAGSSLAGQAVNQALVMDTTRHLDQVLEVNREERWVRLQPGLVLDELNLYLRPYGLQFGPDPASSNRASLGGIVSNNSTGAHSILYGMTADHVLEMDVILSDGTRTRFGPLAEHELAQKRQAPGLEGEIYRKIHDLTRRGAPAIRAGTPRHWRRCGGYNLDRFVEGTSFRWPRDPRFNLAKLVSGAEGTLAVITEIKLNLVPRPQRTAVGIVHFASLKEALSAVPLILEIEPSAVELIDHIGLTNCRKVPEYARLLAAFLQGDPNCVLITEFYGQNEAELRSRLDRLDDHLRRHRAGQGITRVLDPQEQARVWKVRKVALGFLMSVKGDYKPIPFIEDAAVPVEYLADYILQIERFCHDLGTEVGYYAHASAGCLHVRPLINTKIASDIQKMPAIMQFSVELLGEYGGSLSSEHGDGRARSWINQHFFGPELYALYRQTKQAFDPHNLLNPGNIVDAGPMTENLRYGTDYRATPIETFLDFSDDLGFDRAIENCSGVGVCRKKTTGTMCPSFMVTREEEHSTRGRANALRAALSGALPHAEFTSERMYQVMDLCVECKACKAECPSAVDMAKIKFEFLAQYYRTHRVPLRSRLFADIARASRFSSGVLAPVVNRLIGSRPARWGLQQIGISPRRGLPRFARQPFTRWFAKRSQVESPRSKVSGQPATVVLFNDTFNTYQHPEVARAAVEVLEAAGFEVVLPGHGCCGRPMISKGLLEQARGAARDTVARLYPYAAQGIPIVGLEPSCLLTLRDEYLYLLPGDERPPKIAAHSLLFEEFIARLAEEGRLHLAFEREEKHILLHGHCHQKSLVGMGPSKRTLSLPGYSVEEVDSGCCGMAGSFGYEAEHYEISMAMAERRLLPAVRQQPAETLIVAAGVSCRAQIEHGTGRKALHPAQVLQSALKG